MHIMNRSHLWWWISFALILIGAKLSEYHMIEPFNWVLSLFGISILVCLVIRECDSHSQ